MKTHSIYLADHFGVALFCRRTTGRPEEEKVSFSVDQSEQGSLTVNIINRFSAWGVLVKQGLFIHRHVCSKSWPSSSDGFQTTLKKIDFLGPLRFGSKLLALAGARDTQALSVRPEAEV